MATTPRNNRRNAIDAVKRDIIKTAAKKLFAVSGLDGTSVREIARLAGYTTGAIYFHYADKEELYADILRDSLDRLTVVVTMSIAPCKKPIEALTAAFRSFVAFYHESPEDLDLSLYLLGGARPKGLTPALNRELNGKVRAVLDLFRNQFSLLGTPEAQLNVEVAALFSEMIGSLVSAHTGRLKVIGTDLKSVVSHHTANFVFRLSGQVPKQTGNKQ